MAIRSLFMPVTMLLLVACGAHAPEPAPPPASAPPPAAAPAATPELFADLEKAWMDALAEKDRVALERTLAAEFTIIGVGSTPDRLASDRARWLEIGLARPFPRHDVTDVRVTQLGDTAVVQLVLAGDYPPKSLTAEGGRLTFLVTDVWTFREGRWQVVARHSSLPVPPPQR